MHSLDSTQARAKFHVGKPNIPNPSLIINSVSAILSRAETNRVGMGYLNFLIQFIFERI